MRNHRMLMNGLVALVILSPIGAARAGESEEKEAGEAGHAAAKATLQIPDKLPDLWYLVLEKQMKLDQIIAAKELDKVHVAAFEIRDLVQAMPGKTQGFSPESQKKLAESAGRVGDVAKLLDQYGDAADEAKTKDQAARLGTLIKYVESLYPKGALGSRRPAAAPHGGAVAGPGPSNRLELVATHGALSLYVLDSANRTLAIDKMKAVAEIEVEGKEGTAVPLAAAGDHWTGAVTIPKGGSVILEVAVTSAGKRVEGHFVVSEKGAAVREGEEEGEEPEAGEHEHGGHGGK